jgi:ribonucleoside-diphosphate reductase alpha chain
VTKEDKKESKAAAPKADIRALQTTDTQPVEILPKATPATLLNRKPLPKHRRGSTYEVKIGGQKLYLRTGEYEDGQLGEIFLDMSKEGATLRSFLNCFAIAISKGLQYGVPLEEFVNTFIFSRFEPQGIVSGHPNIKTSTSVVDLVFRILGYEYGGRTDYLHIKPEDKTTVVDGPALLAQKGPGADLGEAGEAANPDQQEIDFNPKQPAASDVVAAGGAKQEPGAQATGPSPAPAEKRQSDRRPAVIRNTKAKSVLSEHLESMMGDAPMCDVCGHITVRNGACYKCLNCGNSMGCS